MKTTTFASLYIGSYEVGLKIFEISPKKAIRRINHLRKRLELGKDAYQKGYIGNERLEKLVEILAEYQQIMTEYQVDEYQAFTAGAVRDTSNIVFILDQIQSRLGMKVQVLSNSEHRFISYKAVVEREEFEQMIKDGTALVDVGGGSVQITLFSDGMVKETQQLTIGTIRMKEQLAKFRHNVIHYENQIEEMVNKDLATFQNLYMKKIKIKHIIFVGDYMLELVRKINNSYGDLTVSGEKFIKTLRKFYRKNVEVIAKELELSDEQDQLLIPYIVLYRRLTEVFAPQNILAPGTGVIDGMAFEYGIKNKLIRESHDFGKDILDGARCMANRYQSYSEHVNALSEMSVLMFDGLKKIHGMSERERILVQVAAILHDCGKYISLSNAPQCSFHIIVESELLGLSHQERMIVAYIVLYNAYTLVDYEELAKDITQEQYRVVAKLSAILRISNALDRSHRQKFAKVKTEIKDKQFVVTVESIDEMTLEKGLFSNKTVMFEKIFGLKPVLRERRDN